MLHAAFGAAAAGARQMGRLAWLVSHGKITEYYNRVAAETSARVEQEALVR